MAEGKKKKKWVKAATSNKGALHRHLGIPEGRKIPEERLRAALNSGSATIRKEAQLAMTLKKMRHRHKTKTNAQRIASMYGSKG